MDLNRLAAKIVKQSTDPDARDDGKDPDAVERGQKGGQTRAQRMTAEQRSEAARRAARARWGSRLP
ncbi:MAG: hypothetical protein WBD40_08615 [Tepidisphaeraceae bacterium]